jgi:outer membrane lipoprotein-sorting protein
VLSLVPIYNVSRSPLTALRCETQGGFTFLECSPSGLVDGTFVPMGMRVLTVFLLAISSLQTANAKPRRSPAANKQKASTPAEILRKADDARAPEGDFSFFVAIKDFDGKKLLRTNLYKVFCKGEQYALIETMEPTRLKGRKILLRNEDLWLYLPSVKRPTRISLHQRLTGEVANGDIARARFFDDYTATISGTETLDGKLHSVLDLVAKRENVTYRKVQLWVNQETQQPSKAQFYAISGKLLKTSLYSDFKKALGYPRASKVVIQDAISPTRQSHLTYSRYQREKLDDSFFTKEALQ